MPAPKPNLTAAEINALIDAADGLFGAEKLAAALVEAIGAKRAQQLIATRKAIAWSKADAEAVALALWPLVPGSTAKAKRKAITAAVRPCFATKARYAEVMEYVLEKIEEFLDGPAPTEVSSAYPPEGATVCGYGPVNNHWKLPDSTIRQILDRMQQKNVRAYKVESVGHASEDVLGKADLLAQMKAKTLFSKAECAKRGIIYHVTLFNDNAGKNTWKNAGPSLGDRLAQAKAFIDWFAANVDPVGTEVVIVGETRTAAGKALETYGAKVLKAAGFRIGNNNGSRPKAPATFGGIRTDFFEYHPTKTGDWPADKKAHVTSDTGTILAQLNQNGNVYGLGNPAAMAAWRAAGVAAGYARVIYYGFDVAEYDEAAIDAMSPGPAAANPQPDPAGWPAELSNVVWLHANVRDWPATATISGANVAGGEIRFPYNMANIWPVATSGTGKGTNANVWAIVQISGKWYAATFEWLRKGQTSKPVGCLDGSKGDHFKVAPLNTWRPKSGERFYVMVSGHARAAGRTVRERSNPVEIVWP
jgi:hypothetical protein